MTGREGKNPFPASLFSHTILITAQTLSGAHLLQAQRRLDPPRHPPAQLRAAKLQVLLLRCSEETPPSGLPDPPPALTPAQFADYELHGYKCEDRLHIPGIFPLEKLNLVLVNGREVKIGDRLALLMRLAVELKKGRGGWVHMSVLQAAGCVSSPENRQPVSNLRTALKGRLREGDGKKFIESDRAKQLRLSTHPDFVTYDREKLKTHPDPNVRKLIP